MLNTSMLELCFNDHLSLLLVTVVHYFTRLFLFILDLFLRFILQWWVAGGCHSRSPPPCKMWQIPSEQSKQMLLY